jgi:peptidoglycan/xylan/chitin deacetylase (PgdA/CDA1 family)
MNRIAALLATLALLSAAAWPAERKLIALTFDDGPRPYVLLGKKDPQPTPGLLDLLDRNGVKATFFVMGWRLTPKTFGERHEPNIGVTCLDAAAMAVKRGHEIENHTFSHLQLRTAEKRYGDDWVLNDIDHGAAVIRPVTNTPSHYLRPPNWVMWPELQKKLESRGYTVLSIAGNKPAALRDVNSLDYLCAGVNPTQCPKPSLADSVLRQIAGREKQGVYTHILTFHELSSTVATLQTLLPELKARGYEFVRLDEYMKIVGR